MNTRSEIEDAFDGIERDLPPPAVFTQSGTVGQMDACGCHWPDVNFDIDGMVGLSLQLSRSFGFATARVPYCITVEAERLGAQLTPGRGDSQPSVVGSPYRGEVIPEVPGDLMSPEEFASGGRCAMVAEAARRIASTEELFVTAGMVDNNSIAMHLLGAENMIMGYLMDRDAVLAWSRAMVPYASEYAARLSEAADNVTIIAGASSDLMDPAMYEDFSGSALRGIVSSAKESRTTVHSCGNTLANVDDLVSSGADALSLEASHDPVAYLEAVGGRCMMVGAVDPVATLLMKGPEEVRAAALSSADLGFDIVTPECGVAPRTPDENLLALSEYRGRRWGGVR